MPGPGVQPVVIRRLGVILLYVGQLKANDQILIDGLGSVEVDGHDLVPYLQRQERPASRGHRARLVVDRAARPGALVAQQFEPVGHDGAQGDDVPLLFDPAGENFGNGAQLLQFETLGVSRSLKKDMTCSFYTGGKDKYPVAGQAKGLEKLLKPDAWNKIRLEAKGDTFTVWLNGEQVTQYTDAKYAAAGPIGLQIHPGLTMKVEFRNVRIQGLP